MTRPSARERIAAATKHIANRQDRALARLKLWNSEPDAPRNERNDA